MREENSLIKKAQLGDKEAFEILVRRYDRFVLNIALGYWRDKNDVDDIYQEVFIRVFRGIQNYQYKSKFSTWLYRITVNVCYEYKRKVKMNNHRSIDYFEEDGKYNFQNNSNDFINKIFDKEIKNIIIKEVEKLPKQLKMAFTLKHFQGFKIREIAKIMSCTEGTIKSYLFTASRKLRKKLEPIIEK